ncbi:hypothetical protein DOTSEDRAFT_41915 [Dothistroma septosporum NZE10]|uniref:Uncharacterized protein n=1 Tax=Dothistroma septosporum (strain NZE10 / CBS 128990) TaxID=675120 RepID=N1PZ56_DOTSN|nr:hypothetical protein DOTSEDRAFT_41915 [Dothistroma septosporum NZE10]
MPSKRARTGHKAPSQARPVEQQRRLPMEVDTTSRPISVVQDAYVPHRSSHISFAPRDSGAPLQTAQNLDLGAMALGNPVVGRALPAARVNLSQYRMGLLISSDV